MPKTNAERAAYLIQAYIDSVYDDMKTPKDVTEENVALILAARQLGNAVYDHPENIKKTGSARRSLRTTQRN